MRCRQALKRCVLILAAAIILAPYVVAAPEDSAADDAFTAGWQSYERGDYVQAQRFWLPLAQAGDGPAQLNLGIMYDYGRGVDADAGRAADYYRQAAAQGLASAQYNLAQLYAAGRGLAPDVDRAAELFALAAAQGLALAQQELARRYLVGSGLGQDNDAAAYWYHRAGLGYLQDGDGAAAQEMLITLQSIAPGHDLERDLEQRLGNTAVTGAPAPANEEPESTWAGTAWPVAHGYAVTSNHVVADVDEVALITPDGRELAAIVVLRDEENDLALIATEDDTNLPPALPLSHARARLGTSVFTIGYPRIDVMGRSPKLAAGIVSSVSGLSGDTSSYQISVPVQPGNSGGPLLNMRGEVVGIVTSMLGSIDALGNTHLLPNIGFARKVNVLQALLTHLPARAAAQPELPQSHAALETLADRIQNSVMLVTARSAQL